MNYELPIILTVTNNTIKGKIIASVKGRIDAMRGIHVFLGTFVTGVLCSGTAIPALAQVTSDGTTNTTVNTIGNNSTILNGIERGNNLFHSFSNFSVPNGGSASFDLTNTPNITTIFSRVTGGNISDINGLIQTLNGNNPASLFLINPAGIVFGENASLNIGGSFVGTTAQSVVFGDGFKFSAVNAQNQPLLTVSVPVGLQYGANPSPINVSRANLAVNSGQNLALLGGNVTITGGKISAPGGQIQLGGFAAAGTINLEGLTANFPDNSTFANVTLSDTAIIDVTSTNNGSIGINAADFTMSGNSKLLAGLTPGGRDTTAVAGDITINATGNTNITEKSLIANDLQIAAIGNGGNIQLNTGTFSLIGGSRIQAVTNATGASGDITVNGNGAMEISGFTDDGLFSGILSRSATQTSGAGGNITVNSPQNTLTLSNRGFIGAVTNSSSNGGIIETNLNNLVIETGGQIVTATTNLGNAGDITINATESVNISGESRDFVPNPFLNLPTFDLNTLQFITDFNANVAESETIPYASVERTPSQIVSGTTILGAAVDGVDYYSFSVTQSGSRVILDIDEGFTGETGSFDTEIFLFNLGTGELIELNDDSQATDGAGGSTVVYSNFTTDSLIDTTLREPGFYVLGVGAFPSEGENNQLVQGSSPQIGDTYTLQVSLENQGTQGLSFPTDPFNPANFNPNLGAKSGISSETSGTGKSGNLIINTGKLIINNRGQISSETLDTGLGGDITLSVDSVTEVNNGAISNITHGIGNSGNLAIDTERLQLNGGELEVKTFGLGNTGNLNITASESVLLLTDETTGNRGLIELDVEERAKGNAGLLTLSTPSLRLLNGSQIASLTNGEGNAGNLNITATSVEVIGSQGPFPSAILVRSLGEGDGGNLNINTQRLLVGDGGSLDSLTTGSGEAGNINVRATESVEIIGADPDGFPSGIAASGQIVGRTVDGLSGTSGDILIETPSLRVAQGRIVSTAAGAGDAGNVTIRATEIEVSDTIEDPLNEFGGLSVAVDTAATGRGGNLRIEANRLRVFDGGEITASTKGTGDGGNIFLDVNNIQVTGMSENGDISRIAAVSETEAKAGSININADNLNVRDGAQITVSTLNTGDAGNLNVRDGAQITVSTLDTGDAGNLTINANTISLDNQSSLQANVVAGNQGNINLTSQLLLLRNGSNITTNATGTATGGNINIDTVNLVALENSNITANAIFGQGGNIFLTAQGIFLSADSQITASSLFGVNGTVDINNFGVDPSSGLAELSIKLADASEKIATACADTSGSSFIATGRGGIPQNPNQQVNTNRTWSDIRNLSAYRQNQSVAAQVPKTPETLVEATSWRRNPDGKIELVADKSSTQVQPSLTCAGIAHSYSATSK